MQNWSTGSSSRSTTRIFGVAAIVGMALLIACAPAPQADPTPEPAAVMRLPVSLNEVMVALINDAADPIWAAASTPPASDAQWRALERNAYRLELGGALLAVPGTGPLDDEWTADPAWAKWADDLRQAGADAVAAVEARDLEAISGVGDRLVVACEECHDSYRQDPPTGGKYGEVSREDDP